MKNTTVIIDEIRKERESQVTEKGYNAKSDDAYVKNELACAALAYNMNATGNTAVAAHCWPWGLTSFKPTTPRRDLIKAAALLVAEIERLDRRDELSASQLKEINDRVEQ